MLSPARVRHPSRRPPLRVPIVRFIRCSQAGHLAPLQHRSEGIIVSFGVVVEGVAVLQPRGKHLIPPRPEVFVIAVLSPPSLRVTMTGRSAARLGRHEMNSVAF